MSPTAARRILFVTGDQERVARFRERFRAVGRPWEVQFLGSAEKVATTLGDSSIDIVIADGSVAAADGVSLLTHIQREHPRVTPLSLIDPRQTGKASHQGSVACLSPHCDAATLRGYVERAYDLHALLMDESVRRTAGQLDKLPSVPRTYSALTEAASNPETSISDIARIIQSDPAMSVKVLQLVNSAFFGLAVRTTSISQAVSYLGLELLKGLVLTAHVFTSMDGLDVKGFSLPTFQLYSVRIARLARKFLPQRQFAEEAFTAGIVHDIGKVVLALSRPAEFKAVLERVTATGEATHLVEREIFGQTHAEVGAYLLWSWGIPFPIVECVAYHHRPSEVGEGARELLAAVHAADAMVGILTCGEPEDRLELPFLEKAGLLNQLPKWRRAAEEECAAVSAAF